jgi:hypothetical protein
MTQEELMKISAERKAANAKAYCLIQWGALAEKLNAILSDDVVRIIKENMKKS